MTAPAKLTMPHPATIAHKAAVIILAEGPLMRLDLLRKLRTQTKNGNIHLALDNAIDKGWFLESPRGEIALTVGGVRIMRGEFFDELQPEPFVGVPAQPSSIDLMARPPLSRKYLTSSHGFRDTIPEWSQRDHQSFRSA